VWKKRELGAAALEALRRASLVVDGRNISTQFTRLADATAVGDLAGFDGSAGMGAESEWQVCGRAHTHDRGNGRMLLHDAAGIDH
jgi:hypothetical protein